MDTYTEIMKRERRKKGEKENKRNTQKGQRVSERVSQA